MRDQDWEIIKILYEKKSITKAADSLYMTQSALTRRIHAIEDELGVELVKRSSKGISFTETGKYLFRKSTVFCDLMDEVHLYLNANNKRKELLRLGLPNSFAQLHISKPLKEYTDTYGNVQLKVKVSSSDVTLQRLVEDSVDVGVICGDFPFLGNKLKLLAEQLYILTPPDAKFEDIVHLPLIEPYHNPPVKQIVYQWWKMQFGDIPQPAWEVPHSNIAIEMVENELGICFLFGENWQFNHRKLQAIPIYDQKGEPIVRNVWLMWTEQCHRNKDMMEFVHFIVEHFNVNSSAELH